MQNVSNLSILAMLVMYMLSALFGYLTFYGKIHTRTIRYICSNCITLFLLLLPLYVHFMSEMFEKEPVVCIKTLVSYHNHCMFVYHISLSPSSGVCIGMSLTACIPSFSRTQKTWRRSCSTPSPGCIRLTPCSCWSVWLS